MKKYLSILLLTLATASMTAADTFVAFTWAADAVCLTDLTGTVATDPADWKGVHLAADNLRQDLLKVTGCTDLPITIGTLGRSKAIDRLAKRKRIDAAQLRGKREKFLITFADGQLVIAGSDKRGTIYGIYELSQQLGVSPWYDWADVPVERHEQVYIYKGVYTDGEPAVRYRGIFLNDEAPCLSGWVGENYGGVYNHAFYARVFELVLRLKGNYLWPAMWNAAFYADDPLNLQTADDMGIIMGTSHHEPMARAHKEWTRNPAHGAWNYDTNQAVLDSFWLTGVERMRHTEDVVTIGMRGNGDEPMGDHADVALLERIVASQRHLIEQATGRPAEETPQVWALYKEVQEYYEKGMQVPRDVILLLCDDNWGNVRALPEKPRSATPEATADSRFGLYYHVDYVGGPRNSKFLNVSQIPRMWEQLMLTYDHGVDQLWILNVGDLKPMELPIDFWFRMAWNPRQFRPDNLQRYTEAFCRQQLGEKCAQEAARILTLQCQYAHRRTPELLDARTFDLPSGEWQRRVDEYDRLERDATVLRERLPVPYRTAYNELIYFPVRVMANLYRMYYAVAMNHHYAAQNDPHANDWADQVETCFTRDGELCNEYNHQLAQGKWNHMMDEIHIGYTSWNNPPQNICPEVRRVDETAATASADPSPTAAIPAATAPFGQERPWPEQESAIVFEAADYTLLMNAAEATWQLIPRFGVCQDGIALFPYTADPDGAAIFFDFTLPPPPDPLLLGTSPASPSAAAPEAGSPLRLTLVLAPTFPFNGGRGQRLTVRLDDQPLQTLNVNEAARYIRDGYHDQNYQWEITRMNRQTIDLPPLAAGTHRLMLCPRDPAIVLEQVRIERRAE